MADNSQTIPVELLLSHIGKQVKVDIEAHRAKLLDEVEKRRQRLEELRHRRTEVGEKANDVSDIPVSETVSQLPASQTTDLFAAADELDDSGVDDDWLLEMADGVGAADNLLDALPDVDLDENVPSDGDDAADGFEDITSPPADDGDDTTVWAGATDDLLDALPDVDFDVPDDGDVPDNVSDAADEFEDITPPPADDGDDTTVWAGATDDLLDALPDVDFDVPDNVNDEADEFEDANATVQDEGSEVDANSDNSDDKDAPPDVNLDRDVPDDGDDVATVEPADEFEDANATVQDEGSEVDANSDNSDGKSGSATTAAVASSPPSGIKEILNDVADLDPGLLDDDWEF